VEGGPKPDPRSYTPVDDRRSAARRLEVDSLLLYKKKVSRIGPVLIVSDDAVLRRQVSNLLRNAKFVTHEAERAEEALEWANADCPSVVVVDSDLAEGKSGYEIYEELRQRIPELPAVFLSGKRTQAMDRAVATLLGIDAYLVKPLDPDGLITSVRTLLERKLERGESTEAELAPFEALTARQLEVLRLLSAGRSQVEIATMLGLSSKTVATHIQNILAKLDVHSRAEAVAMAHTLGLMARRETSLAV
jgi:DNA-binding NarL/FixJ family response regulator